MKIAILGAGVAGISSAIALKQHGFDVSVYERHDSASNIGAGIVIWPNAAYVLEQLGVLHAMQSVSGYPTRMQRVSNTGEDLGAIDIQLINRHMGYESLSILRRDFQTILHSKLAALGVAIHYGHAVTQIEPSHNDQAIVHFHNGLKITADLLIGADGRMASCARQFVHGDNAPVYQNFINWIGVYESDVDTVHEMAVTDYWGTGARFGIVPITPRKAYWAGGLASAGIAAKISAEYKRELSMIFANWPTLVQQMIEHTPVDCINKIYVHDQNPMRAWHKNNLIVIGDAAHASLPTSGQGACQALEDSWHLALCLRENSADLAKVFTKFTELRLEKTTGIIMAGRGFAASLFNTDPLFCAQRNETSKRTDFTAVAAAMSHGWARHLPMSA